MAQTQAQYINMNLKRLANYINHLAALNKKYKEAIERVCSKSILSNDIQLFNTRLNMARLPILKGGILRLEHSKQDEVPTGGASMLTNPNKADFSELEHPLAPNMLLNEILNKNNPDAQELANIFLASPRRAPESEEYKYIPPSSSCILNSKYNLKGNKKINKFWSGFAYSKYSTLAKNVSSYADLKNQLVKHYNSNTGLFDTDKIDVNFDNDKNLHLALGHATILEPAIDEKGYFHGILFDKYDFDLEYEDSYGTLKVNYFWLLQELHKNKNFYILAPITFKW